MAMQLLSIADSILSSSTSHKYLPHDILGRLAKITLNMPTLEVTHFKS